MPIAFTHSGRSKSCHDVAWTLKKRKWKKIRDERLAELQAVQREAKEIRNQLLTAGESLGRVKVQASDTIEEAAKYLGAVAKQYEMESLPQIPADILKEWVDLHSEISKSLGIGVAGATISGVTATAPSALYTAAGLFGVASTGCTRIAGLSGAAANSARLAWIGGGAVAAGGGGMAGDHHSKRH